MQIFRSGWFLFICVMILAVANVSVYRAALAPRALEVSVLDVGKAKLGEAELPDASLREASGGSAALVRTPDNMTVLVNAGSDASILRALGDTLSPWQRRIDAIILTGTKAALGGGLPDVERRYSIGAVVRTGDEHVPYGASLVFDGARLTIISSETFVISYGATSSTISSTTPSGVYTSDGKTITKN